MTTNSLKTKLMKEASILRCSILSCVRILVYNKIDWDDCLEWVNMILYKHIEKAKISQPLEFHEFETFLTSDFDGDDKTRLYLYGLVNLMSKTQFDYLKFLVNSYVRDDGINFASHPETLDLNEELISRDIDIYKSKIDSNIRDSMKYLINSFRTLYIIDYTTFQLIKFQNTIGNHNH